MFIVYALIVLMLLAISFCVSSLLASVRFLFVFISGVCSRMSSLNYLLNLLFDVTGDNISPP